MRLESTYRDSGIHESWQSVYRQDRFQSTFDDRVYDWLFRRLNPSLKWLDAGCGTGHHALRLAGRGCQVTAVDLSSRALSRASESAGAFPYGDRINWLRGSLEDLPPNLEAENVHCRGVLMHIPDWRQALANLCRQIKPGGFLVLFESNLNSAETVLVRLLRRVVAVKSNVVRNDSGLEFWSEVNGNPFLARVFDLRAIYRETAAQGLTPVLRRSLFLVDPNRLPAPLRSFGRRVNSLWFRANAPFAAGVILAFRRNPVK